MNAFSKTIAPSRCRRCGGIVRSRRTLPFWRSYSPMRMAGDLVQVGSDDKVRVFNNDKIVVAGASDPCCCVSGTPCTDCPDQTPLQYTVTIADMVNCGCIYSVATNTSWQITSGMFNGTYCLIQISPCVWRVLFHGPVIERRFGAGCSGTLLFTDDYWTLNLIRTSGTWTLAGFLTDTTFSIRYFGNGTSTANVSAANCTDSAEVTNNNLACSTAGDIIPSYNGTGVITVGC